MFESVVLHGGVGCFMEVVGCSGVLKGSGRVVVGWGCYDCMLYCLCWLVI